MIFAMLLMLGGIEADLHNLGHEEWRVREEAMKNLIARGKDVWPQVGMLYEESNDPEVRHRCQRIVASYFSVTEGYMPSILGLPKEYRFMVTERGEKIDVAEQYFNKARELMTYPGTDDHFHRYAPLATKLLLTDMLLESSDGREEAQALKERIDDNCQKVKELLNISDNEFADAYFHHSSRLVITETAWVDGELHWKYHFEQQRTIEESIEVLKREAALP